MNEKYSVSPVEEMYVAEDALEVPVSVYRYEEEYHGSSRDEEYVEEHLVDSEVFEVSCPLLYVYVERDDGSVDEWEDADAVSLLEETEWDSVTVVDAETVEFVVDGELFVASYDASELDEYRF